MKKLKALGFTVTQDRAGETFGGECGNVYGVREGELDGSLLLSSHMDRVPNGLGIRPVEKDGILYSDGTTILAADDISGVCAILEGVRRVLDSGRPLPRLEIYFSVGEELTLCGAVCTDVSIFKSRMGYIFDSPGRVGRFVNAAPAAISWGLKLPALPPTPETSRKRALTPQDHVRHAFHAQAGPPGPGVHGQFPHALHRHQGSQCGL